MSGEENKSLKEQLAEFLRFQAELGLWGVKVSRRAPPSRQAVPQVVSTPKAAPSVQPLEAGRAPRAESAWKGSSKSRSEIEAQLKALREEIGECVRCRLHQGRRNIVFGVGNPKTRIVFVGEGPGEDEDRTGVPFVGRAGQLLDRIIAAMDLSREKCYICNIVKCRPPNNRNPMPDEASVCGEFVKKQLEIIQPEIIVALGAVAANYLLNMEVPIGKLRGRFYEWRGARIMPTYHPSFLLRSPQIGRPRVWEDMQKVMVELGLEDPRKKAEK